MKVQDKTIAKIEKTMRSWIEDHLEEYQNIEPSQILRTVSGERAIKANPAAQEIRAAFKDYCYVVKVQRELAGAEKKPGDVSSIEELRKKFKVV